MRMKGFEPLHLAIPVPHTGALTTRPHSPKNQLKSSFLVYKLHSFSCTSLEKTETYNTHLC